MNKRGSILDILWIGIVLFILSLTTILVYKVYSEIDAKFQASDDLPTESKTASSQMLAHYPGIIDNSFLFITIIMAIIAFALATLVRVHPIFFVFYIIVLAIVVFLCGVFSNVYQTIAGNSEFTALADNLTFTSHIMKFLPFIVSVFGTILAVIMYKLWDNTRQGF